MKRAKDAPKQRLKLILMALCMAAVGTALVLLYLRIQPEAQPGTEPTAAPATATAPATAPAHYPSTPDPARARASRNMGGMLLLFGLVAFTVSGACILLLILDIRRSRPAWKTQTRYPRRR